LTSRAAAFLFVVGALGACGGTPAEGVRPDGGGSSDVGAPAPDTSSTPDVAVESAPEAAAHEAAADIPPDVAPEAAPDVARDVAPEAGADAAPDATDAAPLPAPLPVGFPAGSAPRTESKSFMGPLTKTTIGFQIYLPPGYDSGTLRYPVVYDLHGLTGSQFEDPQWVVPSLETAMKSNRIGPVIVVFPDGLMESYYADGKGGVKPSETRIVRELIPYVDATYRTVAHRQLRAVTGFSMGGYGAMELATKFPDVFRAGVAYDAALDTWATLLDRRAYIAAAQFGDDQAYFDMYSPWANATKNAAALRAAAGLRLVPGATYQMFDAAFRDHLVGLAIPLDYLETTCPHDYGCLLTTQGPASWVFIQSAFTRR
jgi:endo-1,4-beta-xylanase